MNGWLMSWDSYLNFLKLTRDGSSKTLNSRMKTKFWTIKFSKKHFLFFPLKDKTSVDCGDGTLLDHCCQNQFLKCHLFSIFHNVKKTSGPKVVYSRSQGINEDLFESLLLRHAKQTLNLILQQLSNDCFFNIFSFGSTFTSLWEESLEYSADNIELAKSHIRSLEVKFYIILFINHILINKQG